MSLSPLHAMLARIGREQHAARLNRIVNDPSVLPFVKGDRPEPLDFSIEVANPDNYLLMGQHGGVFFEMVQGGIYEAHTQVLPEGRGEWTTSMVHAALHWMFTRTDALEIVTKVPKGNYAARALTRAMGLIYDFTAPELFRYRDRAVPVDVYRQGVQDWLAAAPGLEERGQWLAGIMESVEANRHLGAACEMLMGDQSEKAEVFYNRWATLANRPPLVVCSLRPLAINIGGAIAVVRDNGEAYLAVSA